MAYVDGRRVAQDDRPGGFGDWDRGFALLLANETTGDRPWLGRYHMVAIYDRALTAAEVARHTAAGARPLQRPAGGGA